MAPLASQMRVALSLATPLLTPHANYAKIHKNFKNTEKAKHNICGQTTPENAKFNNLAGKTPVLSGYISLLSRPGKVYAKCLVKDTAG